MNWAEFFAMGGYGFYVWGSYVLAAVVLTLNVLIPLRRSKRVHQTLRQFYRLRSEKS